ncbi:MAG TPA: three-Cys-motif partner protein TcmP [Terriglobales bacterium]|nr:three-Cys-motif partner protein TcmP [Terriglobales bacterium]
MSDIDDPILIEDGLQCPEVGSWTEIKQDHVAYYAKLFSSGMKNKWGKRVYVDLYAGAGYARVRGTARLIMGSPLRALLLADPFDKYVFCEEDAEKLEALKMRVKRVAPARDVAYVSGNCNQKVDEILTAIPFGAKGHTVLSLCFADPYDISLKFTTLRTFAQRYIDFIVLLAVWSDANRAYKRYVMEDAFKVDEFLGSSTWRERWTLAQLNAVAFPKFLAEEFAKSMERLGYLPTPLHKMKRVSSDEKNLPLYYIAMFSKHSLAHDLWDDVLKYGTDQTAFEWDR